MKQRLLLLTAALAAVATLVVVPMTSASSVDTKLQIGQSLRFAGGPGASSGTFVASGAIRDSGTVTSRAVLTPFGNQDDGRLEGTETFVGRLGTFTTEFSGIAGPVGTPHVAGKGTFRIVDGTGAYAELRGQGTFLVVVDFSTLQAVRTDEGQAN
ncbi:MAG: hypothetical protein WKF65_09660 [Gaiellaceae bacterium]